MDSSQQPTLVQTQPSFISPIIQSLTSPQQQLPLFLSHNNIVNKFTLPDIGQIRLNPFPKDINKRILTCPQFLQLSQIPKTFTTQFIKQFQYIAGKENLFPILLQVTTTNIYVCSKDCFITFNINEPSQYEKVKLPQMPTSFKAYKNYIFFGLTSGTIIIYNITSKNTLATCQQFTFPVLQIQVINKDNIIAIDSYGNLKLLTISTKMFMDKIIKISINATDLVQQYRVKKRDKIKNLVKNLPFRKGKDKQKEKSYDVTVQNVQSQQKQQKTANKVQQQNCKFTILSETYRNNSQIYPLIYYYKGQIKCLTLKTSDNTKISQQIIQQKIQGSLGMLELGQGGFTHSNQAHIILVVTIQNNIHYFRQIHVQNSLQFIQISLKVHSNKIYDGKFISNNLLIFLTSQGIQLSNVNSNIQLVQKINYDKFSYIDFFNEQQQFNFDKRLLYRNILNIGTKINDDCMFCCLEGKRIINGVIEDWKNYLNLLIQEYQWDKCMKCALMIYQDGIRLLGGIPQKLQERHQKMKGMFQKIALTYLSYSLKNSQNPLQYEQIIHNVIDFMVRTQSFTYLFTTIYEASNNFGLEEVFMEQLQQYIESGSVKWMTQQVLFKVVAHYTTIKPNQKRKTSADYMKDIQKMNQTQQKQEQGKEQQKQNEEIKQKQVQKSKQQKSKHDRQVLENREHLQTMIMSFDLTKMQKSLIFSICLNNQLYRSLIHICKQQKDYVTPVIKLCGLRISKIHQYKTLKQKNETQNIQTLKKIQIQLCKLSQLIFYYLSQCLRGRMTQFDNTKQYLQMLIQILKFILNPSSLLMLLQSSSQYTFRILSMIFSAQVIQHILQNANIFKIRKFQNSNSNQNQHKYGKNTDIQDIYKQQIGKCKYKYANILINNHINDNDKVTKQYHTIFNNNYNEYKIKQQNNNQHQHQHQQQINNTLSQQFTIYNDMLATIIYTILNNYNKYHINNNNYNNNINGHTNINIIQKQTVHKIQKYLCKSSQQSVIQIYKHIYMCIQDIQLSQQQLSQLYLYKCHKFILYLLLTNSFPIRLAWRLLAFQFIVTFPFAFQQCYNKNVNNNKINAVAMRIIDSINRENCNLIDIVYRRKNQDNYDDQQQKITLYLLKVLQNITNNKKQIQSIQKCLQQQQKQNKKDSMNTDSNDYQQLFIQTKCYLLDTIYKSHSVIQTLIASHNKKTKIQVFTYLQQKINKLIQNQLQNICNDNINKVTHISLNTPIIKTFIQNIIKLLQIQQCRTLQILIKVTQILIQQNKISISQLTQLVQLIKQYPQTYLHYIQNTLHSYQLILHLPIQRQQQLHIGINSIAKYMQKLAIMHLQTVLAHKKQQLQNYVLKINYPLQQAFKVCEQCNNKTAMAYILIKSGRNLQGAMLISDLFISNSRQVFRDLAKNQESQNTKQVLQKMNGQLTKILQTCTNEYNNDVHKGEEMWEKVSQKLFKQLNIKAVDTIPIVKIRQILQRYLDQIIKSMFMQVNPQFFIQKFSQNAKMPVPTKWYLVAHDLVYQRLGFQFQINSLTKQLLRINQMKQYRNIFKCHMKGVALALLTENCQKCQLKLDRKNQNDQQVNNQTSEKKLLEITVFNCGHAYHTTCFQELKETYDKCQKPKQQLQSPTIQKNNKKLSVFVCPICKSQWDGILHGQLNIKPQIYKMNKKNRQKQILIERKNKLADFDAYDFFKITGEQLLQKNNK